VDEDFIIRVQIQASMLGSGLCSQKMHFVRTSQTLKPLLSWCTRQEQPETLKSLSRHNSLSGTTKTLNPKIHSPHDCQEQLKP
jgi:hypothetical protein